ncbi:MAG: hypothetical protein LBC29_04875 [Propionibacteriaceae bacterium]|jgi:prolyl-tRNA editing enzyme YbaK/EbsC (Cys-tRNA(Pro) deacylase)|nr:hypothetical protein [Propionibacteriaceae bacterium]
MFDSLDLLPASEHPELLAPAVFAAVNSYVPNAQVFAIDPALSDTAALVAATGLPPEVMCNAVLLTGLRAGEQRQVCCLTLFHRRIDVNNVVKRTLDVRKASFAPMDYAVEVSGMAYGGITPVGLPADWPVWLDEPTATSPLLLMGSGIRASKLVLPGPDLLRLSGARLVENLTIPI